MVIWLAKVFPESKVTPKFLTSLVGEIEFPRNWVGNFCMIDSLSVANDDKFCLLWIKFQSDTIHPFLNASKTLCELSNTGIKVPGIKCHVNLGVIGIKMMGNIETGNYMDEGGSVKSEKQWTQDRTLRDPIRE